MLKKVLITFSFLLLSLSMAYGKSFEDRVKKIEKECLKDNPDLKVHYSRESKVEYDTRNIFRVDKVGLILNIVRRVPVGGNPNPVILVKDGYHSMKLLLSGARRVLHLLFGSDGKTEEQYQALLSKAKDYADHHRLNQEERLSLTTCLSSRLLDYKTNSGKKLKENGRREKIIEEGYGMCRQFTDVALHIAKKLGIRAHQGIYHPKKEKTGHSYLIARVNHRWYVAEPQASVPTLYPLINTKRAESEPTFLRRAKNKAGWYGVKEAVYSHLPFLVTE